MERLLSWSWLQEPFTAKGNLLALDAFGNQSLTELDGWYGLGEVRYLEGYLRGILGVVGFSFRTWHVLTE